MVSSGSRGKMKSLLFNHLPNCGNDLEEIVLESGNSRPVDGDGQGEEVVGCV